MAKFNHLLGFMNEFETHILELETISKLIRFAGQAAEGPSADKVMNLLIAADHLLSDQADLIYSDFRTVWREFMAPNHDLKTWIAEIGGDYDVTIPDDVLKELGWAEGDEVDINVLKDGTISITRSVSPE
jgi:AbrB family looped-hinge helix DNA binding protein